MILSDQPRFYGSYLAIANGDVPTNLDADSVMMLRDRGFTKYVIDHEDPVTSVKMLSFVVSHSLLKPQRLLVDHEDYYIAVDMFTNTYYICYRDLMMIDIDRYKTENNNDTLEDIKIKLSFHPELFFRIYASRNGYHIFVINKSMNYRSDDSIKLMSELGCDFYYIVYSYLRGWSVRLNKKKGEETTDQLYTWVGDMVRGQFFSPIIVNDPLPTNVPININEKLFDSILPDARLESLTDLHITLVEVFKNAGLCSMPAPK
ncbi:Hypothetical protein HVR_LOCUS304 [uncultured virus]|nr:Hypothetical protein HVR_LOCUS304 [uncultured virus]